MVGDGASAAIECSRRSVRGAQNRVQRSRRLLHLAATAARPSGADRRAPRRSARDSAPRRPASRALRRRSRVPSVTSPMCTACRSHLSNMRSTSASRPRFDDEQHALLRFGEHDFVRRHAGLALRHERHVDLDAGAAARSHLGRRTGQARRRPCPGCRRARRSA